MCVPCRISDAKFSVDGKAFKLAANDGTSSIHGGTVSKASGMTDCA